MPYLTAAGSRRTAMAVNPSASRSVCAMTASRRAIAPITRHSTRTARAHRLRPRPVGRPPSPSRRRATRTPSATATADTPTVRTAEGGGGGGGRPLDVRLDHQRRVEREFDGGGLGSRLAAEFFAKIRSEIRPATEPVAVLRGQRRHRLHLAQRVRGDRGLRLHGPAGRPVPGVPRRDPHSGDRLSDGGERRRAVHRAR